MDSSLSKNDLSFWDNVPDDINSFEDFEKNIEALNKHKKILDEKLNKQKFEK